MKIEIGSEKRFFDFIKDLSDKDKIALISHTDLDGLGAAKVVYEVVKPDLLKFVGYDELNDSLIDQLRKKKITKIIFTDLMFKDNGFVKSLDKYFEVLIIDHHPPVRDWNSERVVFLKCEEGYCATYFCYELFMKLQDIERLDWLVACACVSDFCHVKPAEWLSEIYEKYGDEFEMKGRYVRQSGKFWDMQWNLNLALIYFKDDLNKVFELLPEKFGELGVLGKHTAEVQKEIDLCVVRFEKEKESFKNGYFWKFSPKFRVGSIVSNVVCKEDDKTYIICRDSDEKHYSVSARRQDKKEDMGKLLNKLIEGFDDANAGGHVPAAGGSFLKKDLAEFRRRLGLKTIQN